MRVMFLCVILLFGTTAYAQQCAECILADACIKEYTRATSKIKTDYKKSLADRRKGREQTLRERYSQRGVVADEGVGTVIKLEIDKLRDCLSRVR